MGGAAGSAWVHGWLGSRVVVMVGQPAPDGFAGRDEASQVGPRRFAGAVVGPAGAENTHKNDFSKPFENSTTSARCGARGSNEKSCEKAKCSCVRSRRELRAHWRTRTI